MKLLAIDSNSIINRAFYGVKPLTSKDGTPTNAVYGFFGIFLKLLEETAPDAVAFAFDLKAPTFRHKLYSGYKAQRKGMPPELAVQLPIVKNIISALGYKTVEIEGFEADDILGSRSSACERSGWNCVIATGDRDSMQLVSDKTFVRLAWTQNGSPQSELFDVNAVIAKYGIPPEKLIDLKAIMGDASDNIPGVPGIGEKGAAALISQYGSLDNIYDSIDSIDKLSLKTKLINGKDSAYMSRVLATISKDAPVDGDIASYIPKAPDRTTAAGILSKLDMFKLIEKLGLSAVAVPTSVQKAAAEPKNFIEVHSAADLPVPEKSADVLFDFSNDNIIQFAVVSGGSVYHTSDTQSVKDYISRLLSSDTALRTDNSKLIYRFAQKNNIDVKNITFDLSLAAYLLTPSASSYSASELAASYEVPITPNENKFLSDCSAFSELCDTLFEKIRDNGMEKLLSEIELPLAEVLASMELAGFSVDADGLEKYGEELDGEIAELKNGIYMLAGREFNINSPKQLAETLFDDLGLPSKSKTKNGYSTNADTLEYLRSKHPIIDLILRYRRLTKLKSTYVNGFLGLCADGKIHSTFIQTETRTGRISSVEPNMQNIPIRTDEGSKMRKFFIPSYDWSLVDADYSQIELRILAHISNDDAMRDAFMTGTDIHTKTAAQVFGVPEQFVTHQMRSRAKAVNFGIVYGIGAFSLSNDISVSVAEADRYIKNYLNYYSGVKNYMERIIEEAKTNGYVTTLFGRRRYIPELIASNHATRAFGERAARNAPIQGSAADIIKLAMIKVFNRMKKEGLRARLILQVHDELIVEAPSDEISRVSDILKEEMENAVSRSVPMTVEIGVGKNWLDAK